MKYPKSQSSARITASAEAIPPRAYALGAALLSCLYCVSASAGEPPTPKGPEEPSKTLAAVRVSAAPEPTKGREVSLETVQRTQAKDLAEVFANEPSVSVGGATRAAQRLYLRGIEATNLNVTIDGATQGRPLFQHRGDVGGIDPDLLKGVVIQTAGSSDAGVGALAGGIQFETVDAQDLLEGKERFGGNLKTSYSSASNARRAAATLFGRATDKLGVLFHVSAENANEYKSGSGDRVHGTGGDDREYFLKLSLLEQGPHSLRLSAERNQDQGDYLFKADAIYSATAELEYQVGRRDTYVVDYRYRPEGSRLADFRANLYSNDRQISWVADGNRIYDKDLGGDIRNTFGFDLGPTKHRFTAGLDFVDGQGAYEQAAKGKIGVGDIKTRNIGYFLQDRLSAGRFGLSLGARLDDYETNYGSTPVKGNRISPSGRLDVAIGGGLSAFGAYSEAVRSTSVVPIGWFGYTTSTPTFNQKTGKDSYGKAFLPEESTQRELGLVYEAKGLLTAEDVFTAQATVFRTRLLNLVQQVQTGATTITGFYNDDPVLAKGYELKATWQKAAWRSSLSFLHSDLLDKNGQPYTITRRIGAPSGDRLNLDLRWQAAANLSFGYTLNAVDGLEHVSTPLSGYAIHGLQAQWQPAKVSGLGFSLSVNNLFDRQYSDQTSMPVGEPERGRDIRMGVNYRF